MKQNQGNKEYPPGSPGALWHYSISFIADTASVAEHYHHCYKIVVSLDNSFECMIDGQAFFGLKGFIINQSIPHSCFAPDANVLVNFIESDSLLGWQLRDLLAGKAYLNIDSVLSTEQYSQVLPPNYTELSNETLIPYVNTFLDSLLLNARPASDIVTDERIVVILQYIEQHLSETIDLEHLAGLINLSSERTRHLFVQEMGIPFTQYIMWQRIRKTMVVAITEESKLIEACLRFGFTDQPHFNRTFKRIFGMTPGGIIRYCRVLM